MSIFDWLFGPSRKPQLPAKISSGTPARASEVDINERGARIRTLLAALDDKSMSIATAAATTLEKLADPSASAKLSATYSDLHKIRFSGSVVSERSVVSKEFETFMRAVEKAMEASTPKMFEPRPLQISPQIEKLTELEKLIQDRLRRTEKGGPQAHLEKLLQEHLQRTDKG